MDYAIFAINPGSTSTKVAFFRGAEEIWNDVQRFDVDVLRPFATIADQEDFRLEEIRKALARHHVSKEDLDAVVGRGGLIKPIPGGTYAVSDAMVEILRAQKYGAHASNLGAPLAKRLAKGKPAFIVDPVVVDELVPEARLSGLPQLTRRSIFHALNQKAVGRRAAADLGKPYEKTNLVIAHLGGGISVGAHLQGRVVDVNNALDGDGPFSPERSGGLPSGDLARLCFSGTYDMTEVMRKIVGGGGMVAHLGTNDLREAQRAASGGDPKAVLVLEAMAYGVAKEIGARAVALRGKVDAVILTGGLAYSEEFVRRIGDQVSWIAPVRIYPGEDELQALAEGALRVLSGQEAPRIYED